MSKRIVAMLLSLVLLGGLAGCSPDTGEDNSSSSGPPSSSQPPSSSSEPAEPVIYPPEQIKRQSKDYWDNPYERHYRHLYYAVDGFFINIVGQETFNKWAEEVLEKKHSPQEEPSEMMLKAMIEYFEVPREEFDKALQKLYDARTHGHDDMTKEEYELPNGDIIYTFDDEIINEYYKY